MITHTSQSKTYFIHKNPNTPRTFVCTLQELPTNTHLGLDLQLSMFGLQYTIN
jgi:hypothetical protein